MRVMSAQSLALPIIHASTCVIFAAFDGKPHVLLSRTPNRNWQLPTEKNTGEYSLEDTAVRYLGAQYETLYLRQIATYSQPGRHPGAREIATSFLVVPMASRLSAIEDKVGSGSRWFNLASLPSLAYDHEKIIRDACRRLKELAASAPIVFRLLPDRFTLSEVQELQESLLGKALHRPNFRRTLSSYEFLQKTREKRIGVKGGPALYRIDYTKFG